MANRLLYILLSFLLLAACHGGSRPSGAPFAYHESKFWAHCVSTVELGRARAPLFDGLEVDINYSASQDRLFMGHELWDTCKGLTLDAWLDSLPQPVANCLWLDTKNLTPANAPRIAHLILAATRLHSLRDRVMVESQNDTALQTLKDSGLHVILLISNS